MSFIEFWNKVHECIAEIMGLDDDEIVKWAHLPQEEPPAQTIP